MNEALQPAVKLQGDIMKMLVPALQDISVASNVACEIIHLVLTSRVATAEIREAYAAIPSAD
jgi:hypothetical protein